MGSDNSDRFLTGVNIDENEKNVDVQELQNIIGRGCWVLVKYSTNKLIKRFVDNVVEQNDGVIKFTRPYNNKFVWQKIEDTDTNRRPKGLTQLFCSL